MRQQSALATCNLKLESRAVAEQDVLQDDFAAGCGRAYSRVQRQMNVQASSDHVLLRLSASCKQGRITVKSVHGVTTRRMSASSPSVPPQVTTPATTGGLSFIQRAVLLERRSATVSKQRQVIPANFSTRCRASNYQEHCAGTRLAL